MTGYTSSSSNSNSLSNSNNNNNNNNNTPIDLHNSSYPALLLDELWKNITNREEILRKWSEKLKLEHEQHDRMLLHDPTVPLGQQQHNLLKAGGNSSEQIIETSISSLLPDSVWTILWIALYVMVLIVIIVVTIKACILFFEKTDDAKFEDCKDSPNILRMAVAGRNNLRRQSCNPMAAVTVPIPTAVLEHQRSISPRSVILQQPSPNSTTRPCYIYNAGAYNAAAAVGVPNSAGSSAGSCSWTHPFATTNCCSKAGGGKHQSNSRRLLRSSGRGVSLESELMMTPCGNYYLHHSVHNPHVVATPPPHHHSQQQLCTMSITQPTTIPVPVTATSTTGPGPGVSRNQRQYQYQHQHTNDSSLQWDSLNTNTTDHSGESPPSYEIALGVEIASRPQSGTGNCSDREGEGNTETEERT